MRSLRRLWKRLGSWTRTRQDEERLAAEIEDHLARQTAENMRDGLSPVEARRQAVLKFGAVEAVRESYRDGRGLPFVETLWQDTRYAWRRLRNAPAFTITTLLTLALGIGATTSIFTLAHGVLLKSLAVANPNELYRLGKEAGCCYHSGYSQNKEFSMVSYDLYKHFRDNTSGFSDLAAFQSFAPQFGVRRADSSEPAQSYPGEFVSGNYFTTFGVRAYVGRTLTANDDRPSAPPVAVMSYRLWQEKYGSDPSLIGNVFDINEKPFVVVGIAPRSFFGDTLRNEPPDFFLPLNTEPFVDGGDPVLNKPDAHWLDLIGRLQPRAQPAALEAQMRVELKQWLRSHWGEMSANDRARLPEQTLFLRPGGAGITSMREEYEHWLQILMTVTGFVLLIVCANVANLMLVRGMERRRQTSLSMALGAQGTRLMRQALTESILLSLLGGAVGLAIAFVGTRVILHFAFPSTGGMEGLPISASPSIPVLLFAFGVSLLTGVAFGIAPAWMTTRVDPIEALRGANRSTARTGSLPRRMLVVFQAALSLVLLSASGLLTAALHGLENQDFGFDQSRRIVVDTNPMLAGYRPEQLTPLYQRIQGLLSSIPGVSAVALCQSSPLGGKEWSSDVWVEGHAPPGPNDNSDASFDRVTPGYLNVIGNSIIRGRGIAEQDTATSRHVAVINQAFARKFFNNEDPLGKHFGTWVEGAGQYEIVGVARDARYSATNLGKPITPMFFLPEAQHDFRGRSKSTEVSPGTHFLRDIVIVTKPGVSLPFARVRQAMASVDANLPIISIRTLREQVALQFSQQRLIARITSFFGVLSLILSCVGLYGVTAYNAAFRTNEIGIRMALGANRRQVVLMILRGALALLGAGLCVGLPLALAMGRFLGHQLYGMNPYDPVMISAAVAALGFSAMVAAFVPASRASSISPSQALRAE